MITANVIYRVFRLKTEKYGTGFAIEVDGKEYLVTARHIVKSLEVDDEIGIFRNDSWGPLKVRTVGHAAGEIDISVLAANIRLTPKRWLPLSATSEGMFYGQDAYFLGFPPQRIFELMKPPRLEDTGYPLPMVKRATISTIMPPYYWEGFNNKGFSGGPVVFRKDGNPEFQVAAVVSARELETKEIQREGGTATPFTVQENAGIMVAYDVLEAVNLIRKKPIGFDLRF